MADVSFTVDPLGKPINRTNLTQILKQISGVTAVQDAGYNVVTESATLFVNGMSCASCAFHVEAALTDIPGVLAANVNLQTGETAVTIVDNEIKLNVLYEAIQEAGYYPSALVFGN